MQSNASFDIADKYASIVPGSTVLELLTDFKQEEFLKKYLNPKSLPNKLSKPLLEDHHAEGAAEGVCSAAVMHWLDTGAVPPPTEEMAAGLARVQGSFEADTERDYWKLCSNLSKSSKNLKEPVKDSKGLDLNITQTFFNYLLDNSGKINPKFKLFLILGFVDGSAHAVGWNLGTKSFFDPNYGVWRIKTPDPKSGIWKMIPFANGPDAATDIAYSISGLDEIRSKYGAKVSIKAITF
ncbi:hypothetical protein JMJ77_0003018 [Colletotrichum scovillei]|uniref:Uncharacterized protein n=1 Tax=Colletotrichum scovillei TaxID=1209932 RepID=A0A9P7QWB9_9PEZI|nr:hypothetical protein JMJ78_0006233 [Colletotrichum scovillei]KAG7043312.1 hypothetical protein JMJ77_0003018 [Colletotrichum scovillei]KAG7062760.1 hypothetical protein JMJ76_0009603 [Colletotrichum scovillei]